MIRLFVPSFDRGDVDVVGDTLQHARVRRVQPGDAIELLDGNGRVGAGRVGNVGKSRMTVAVERLHSRPRPTALEVLVPVADRDRMLLAAEKCAELQITAWRPVYFARSRSVTPRGEGGKFRDKVMARMQAALEQSGGAWMPDVVDEQEFADAVRRRTDVLQVLLDARGQPMTHATGDATRVALMVGPEGGLDDEERSFAIREGWTPTRLSSSILRFETAIIGGVALVRATQLTEA